MKVVHAPVSYEVRKKAESLFVANNIANGALYPYGFGFLRPADKEVWYEKARAALSGLEHVGKESE